MDADTIERGLQLLNESQAAKLLCLSRACLRHWRAVGKGPPWMRIGERLIRYDLTELRGWISKQAGVRGAQSPERWEASLVRDFRADVSEDRQRSD